MHCKLWDADLATLYTCTRCVLTCRRRVAFHLVALACELGMIGINIATVAVIQEGDGGSSEGRSRQAQMIYIAGSIMLTVLVCIANVIGIRSVMQAMLKAVRRLSHPMRSAEMRFSGTVNKLVEAASRSANGAYKAVDAAQQESWRHLGGAALQPEGCTAADGGGRDVCGGGDVNGCGRLQRFAQVRAGNEANVVENLELDACTESPVSHVAGAGSGTAQCGGVGIGQDVQRAGRLAQNESFLSGAL